MNIMITGASSGIGRALALEYAKEKHTLFISGRNTERLISTKTECEQLGAIVYTKVIDVTDQDQMHNWVNECNQTKPLNLVIANAGISCGQESPENIYQTFNTNLFGVLNTIIPLIEIFKKRAPSKTLAQVALISSLAGYHGVAGSAAYSASKCAVKAYGEALRPRLAKQGIRVNVICPGFIRSGITDKNHFPMPFFMEAPQAAQLIKERLEKNIGLIAFPWPMRFAAWLFSILPNRLSNFIYGLLPQKSHG